MRIALLGSGNVATHLGRALRDAGEEIVQVWSRNPENAAALAMELNAGAVNDPDLVTTEADLYILAVNDDAILTVVSMLPVHDRLVVHTSGSTGMEVLRNASDRIGVLYPLQTFSKSREVDFSVVPLAIEGNSEQVMQTLEDLARKISGHVLRMDSRQRRALHVAAVFACNFTNHLYALAAGILDRNQLDFDLLRPLIRETAEKVQSFMPSDVQTGPAVRGDEETMRKHLEFLTEHPELGALYRELSQSIVNFNKQDNPLL
jgi:predicted short-subunit dehydrogenase-like oxidoreductase (DUF2520 family)